MEAGALPVIPTTKQHSLMVELIEKVRRMKLEEGYSNAEISKETGITVDRIKYMTSKKYEQTLLRKKEQEKEYAQFVELVKKYLPISNSLNNLCNHLGLRGVDGYYKKVTRVINDLNLSTSHFGTIKVRPSSNGRNQMTARPDDEFFVDGKKADRKSIINRLVNGGYKKYECEECGITEWNGKPISLQVHHINGHHDDNRIDNLQILCPNCHSQTDTYARAHRKPTPKKRTDGAICQFCGKVIETSDDKYCSKECSENAVRWKHPGKYEILESIKELKSYSAVGRKFGVCDNTIKKYAKKLGIYEEAKKYIISRNGKEKLTATKF